MAVRITFKMTVRPVIGHQFTKFFDYIPANVRIRTLIYRYAGSGMRHINNTNSLLQSRIRYLLLHQAGNVNHINPGIRFYGNSNRHVKLLTRKNKFAELALGFHAEFLFSIAA